MGKMRGREEVEISPSRVHKRGTREGGYGTKEKEEGRKIGDLFVPLMQTRACRRKERNLLLLSLMCTRAHLGEEGR